MTIGSSHAHLKFSIQRDGASPHLARISILVQIGDLWARSIGLELIVSEHAGPRFGNLAHPPDNINDLRLPVQETPDELKHIIT
jgi:hypothetical protein